MRVAKWGNSLAIRIPKDVAAAMGLSEGDEVELEPGRTGLLRLNRQMSREEALEGLKQFRGLLPEDYRFDRDEANARRLP